MTIHPFTLSFEFFPPKNPEMGRVLSETVEKLTPLLPEFVSVTYGAGGTTQEKTLETLTQLAQERSFPAAGHSTCVGKSKEEVDAVARAYWDAGVRKIVALRGDAPAEQGPFAPHPEGYAGAADLVEGLRKIADFDIFVAAYPEPHPESLSFEADIDHLKRKVDAGASAAITQFFFENSTFLRLRDRAAAAGISIPLIPGILPIMNFNTTRSFAQKCGTHIPPHFEALFAGLENDASLRQIVAANVAVKQCEDLKTHGVSHFHFYTLNRFELTFAICRLLSVEGQ